MSENSKKENKYEKELASNASTIDENIDTLAKSGGTVFGVDTSSVTDSLEANANYIPNLRNRTLSSVSSVKQSGEETLGEFEEAGALLADTFNDEQGWSDLGTAAASAALGYLNSLLEKYKSAWTQTEDISVEEIIGEIAPYTVYTKDLPSIIGNKIVDMLTYILTLGDTVSESSLLSEFLDSMLNDPSIASATSNLKVVQGIAKSISGISKCIDTTKKVLEVVEPYLPIIEIIADMAMVYWSAGQTGVKATQALSEYMSNLCMELFNKCLAIIKRMIFGIKFKMPILLTGALGTLKLTQVDLVDEEGNSLYSEEQLRQGENTVKARRSSWLDTSAADKILTSGTATAYYNHMGSTLSSTSSAVKSLSNKIKSGDLISSPQLKSDGTWDWSAAHSGYTSIWSNYADQVSSATKTLHYTTDSVTEKMKELVKNAKKKAGALEISQYETTGSPLMSPGGLLSVTPGATLGLTTTNLQISMDELTIKKASGDMFEGVKAGDVSVFSSSDIANAWKGGSSNLYGSSKFTSGTVSKS